MTGVFAKLAATAAIGAGAFLPAFAQGQAQRTPVPHLDIGASLDELYDTNVSRTSAEGARLRGLSRSDLRSTPAATVDWFRPIGRQSITLAGSVGYDFYARNTRLNRERIGVDGAFGYDLAGCQGAVTANYARRQSDLGDLVVLGTVDDVQRFRNTEDIKVLGASASCGSDIGFRPNASISQTWADNSTDLRQFSDYNSTIVTGGIGYGRPTFGLLSVFGRVGRTEFPNRVISIGGDRDGFDTGAVGGRFERRIGSRLRGAVELSYTRVSPDRAGVRGFSGLTYSGELTATVNTRLQVTALASRAVQASNRVDANYFIQRDYSLDATYAMSPRIQLTAGVLQRNRNFRGAGAAFGPALIEDRVRAATVGATYEMNRLLTITLSGTHETRDANGDFFDYTSNRIGLGLRTKL